VGLELLDKVTRVVIRREWVVITQAQVEVGQIQIQVLEQESVLQTHRLPVVTEVLELHHLLLELL
jgi:hypothetical protein